MMTATAQTPEFQKDLAAEVMKYTVETAHSVPNLPKGSLVSWTAQKPASRPLQEWQSESLEILAESWKVAPDWGTGRLGPMLTNDIISYAVTCLPTRYARSCRRKLFGSHVDNFSLIELLLIGHALWEPECGIYLNPYAPEKSSMGWSEILLFEDRIHSRKRQN